MTKFSAAQSLGSSGLSSASPKGIKKKTFPKRRSSNYWQDRNIYQLTVLCDNCVLNRHFNMFSNTTLRSLILAEATSVPSAYLPTFFFVVLRPNAGHGLLILYVS